MIVGSILSAVLFIVIREKDELSGLNTHCRPRVGSSSIEWQSAGIGSVRSGNESVTKRNRFTNERSLGTCRTRYLLHLRRKCLL
ncbi:hypothetical protein CH251_17795 [Rhodococcus sp. 06-462-5]|nr:hypothetical protein CH251_17795 [Rhodococcus sp. 06-462-5]OZE69257.1 hypothetical protein CH270_06215 [Rhodococcus sp. 02-925g]